MTPDQTTISRDFIDAPAGARLFASVIKPKTRAMEAAGCVIGSYTLQEKLGDGGFGSVWSAVQRQPVHREVALKVIKLGMDTVEVMSRFEQERVALSLMDHPNIARVLDAGVTPEGRPFFVMELVRGVPLTQYAMAKQLPLVDRLRLFREVCAGVQHAHQKGIIHRDLKPNNILVTEIDGAPVPKIIDFGIAKAVSGEKLTDQTLRTRAEQVIGTPLYMSPEQAEGGADIDTRSDVYALGALLYELLTGCPPFDANTLMNAGFDEMRRIIREVEPRPPSRRNVEARTTVQRSEPSAETPGHDLHPSSSGIRYSKDLDLITLRALAKDRTRRYESVTAFAEDVQRFLNHEPVMAHAPSLLYLTQRWMRRHRAAAVAALTCFVAIITGSSVAVWQAVRATQAQHTAERQLADAEAATKLMTDTLASLPSYGQDQMIRRSDLMKGVVQRVMEFKGEPRRKLRLLDTLAKAVRPLDAIPLQEEVLRLGEALYLPDAPELWSLRYDLARNKAAFSELRAEAMPELRRIYERHREHLGDKHETTMHMALTFARNLIFMGEEKDGVPMLQELIRYSDAHPKAQPAGDRVFYRLDCARGLSQMGRVDEALEMGRDNLRIALQELGDSDFEAARAFQSHGEICLEHEFFQEAEDTLKKAVGMFHRSVGPLDPISEQTVQTLAEFYQEQGMKDKLIDLNRTVLRMHEEKAGMAHIATANRVRWLAQALIHAGRMEEADQETSEWLQRVRLPGGKLPASGESILRGHVDVLRSRADWPRAEAEMREIVGILQAGRPKDPLLWEDQSNLAEMIIQQGRMAEARPLLEEVIAKYEKSKPEPGSRSEMLMRLAKDRLKRAQ